MLICLSLEIDVLVEFEFITVNLSDDQIILEPMNEESYSYRLRHVSVG